MFGAGAERSASVPVFVDNRDDADHEVRVWVDGTDEAFRAQFPVAAGALVKVTDVEAAGFRLHARVLGLDDGNSRSAPPPTNPTTRRTATSGSSPPNPPTTTALGG